MDNLTKEEFFSIKTWYHATTALSAKNIVSCGINTRINRTKPLDFGYGFYLAKDKEWAFNYLHYQLLTTEDDESADENDGYVLEYHIDLSKYLNSFIVRFVGDMDYKFAKIVFKNRKHPFIAGVLYRYDIMGGPMSDGNQIDDFAEYDLGRITKGELFERLLIPKEDWQLALRNQAFCDTLKVAKIYDKEGREIEAIQ